MESKLKEFQRASNHDFNKLLTLHDVIEQLAYYVLESGSHERAFDLIVLYKDALAEHLHIGQFIPCKDGKPIQEPREVPEYVNTGNDAHMEKYHAKHNYLDALEDVIFEGWKPVNFWDSMPGSIGIMHNSWSLEVYENVIYYVERNNTGASFEPLKNLADLARITKANPLTLKPIK